MSVPGGTHRVVSPRARGGVASGQVVTQRGRGQPSRARKVLPASAPFSDSSAALPRLNTLQLSLSRREDLIEIWRGRLFSIQVML